MGKGDGAGAGGKGDGTGGPAGGGAGGGMATLRASTGRALRAGSRRLAGASHLPKIRHFLGDVFGSS